MRVASSISHILGIGQNHLHLLVPVLVVVLPPPWSHPSPPWPPPHLRGHPDPRGHLHHLHHPHHLRGHLHHLRGYHLCTEPLYNAGAEAAITTTRKVATSMSNSLLKCFLNYFSFLLFFSLS